jgi:hypothetical protein
VGEYLQYGRRATSRARRVRREYNENYLVARHGFSPAQVRADQCQFDQNAVANVKFAA